MPLLSAVNLLEIKEVVLHFKLYKKVSGFAKDM